LKTFDFPLDVAKGGSLRFVSGDEAAQQMVRAITRTLPGELPLSRDYGIFIDYNIPHELENALPNDIREAIQKWYPQIIVRTAHVTFDKAGERAEVSVDLELVED